MRLLLLSNSTNHGSGFLDHAMEAIRSFLGNAPELAFVPFALRDQAGYVARVRERFLREGIGVQAVSADAAGRACLERAPAVFVGGGNTFRLLDLLQRGGFIDLIRARGREGMPYLGSSAGTNVAAPTIRTTNDMPILEPASLSALGLVPFQINPHYLDADPQSTHMGETREQRILEFLEENATPVIGLREGAWIRVEEGSARLGGARGARLFRREAEAEERAPGASLDDLLQG
jgi:dipeptidase E